MPNRVVRCTLTTTVFLVSGVVAWLSWPGPWECDRGFDRTSFALAGALKATNPSYHIYGGSDFSPDSCRMTLSVLNKSRRINFSAQPIGYDARKPWLYANVTVKLSMDGSISHSDLGDTYLSNIISNPSTFRESSIEAIKSKLQEYPRASYGLVVGFKEGVAWDVYSDFAREAEFRGRLDASDMVFFGPFGAEPKQNEWLQQGKVTPVAWNWDREVRSMMGRVGELNGIQLDEFRFWVSRLEPNDDQLLRHFGLSLADLQRRATEGLVYGYVAEAPSSVHSKMLDSDHVAWARIIKVPLRGEAGRP
ncbi:hypothetical protein PS9374_03788 [Planomonospora sphaerica]|uniref:Uncharacterized protein n=1 Tax=Planomonospora sphaerica TaxID=161355 RepID=A0A171DEA5_9ACTN|nr:hypothetical protein [Planomonospora sphaerica]GAT68127.1 hypothetical protein PS9374_03788 [Planomonospora sphaerica]